MKYRIIPVTPLQQNCTLFWCEKSHHAAIIDPGGDNPRVMAELDSLGLIPERILLTHGHLDHVGGAAELAERLHIPIEGPHLADTFWLDNIDQQALMFGWFRSSIPAANATSVKVKSPLFR